VQVKKTIFLLLVISFTTICFIGDKKRAQRIVVLDPAGDAKRAGRRIGDSFERGLTLQCAEKIKELVEQGAPHIKVVITRMPGDNVYELQNASLSNRIHADLFINLNFYYCQATKPTLFLYQFSYGNDFVQNDSGLILQSYEQAYRINKHVTNELVQLFTTALSAHTYQQLFTVAAPRSLPIKPLIGIVAPSIAVEAGLKNKELWQSYVEPLAHAIIAAVDNL